MLIVDRIGKDDSDSIKSKIRSKCLKLLFHTILLHQYHKLEVKLNSETMIEKIFQTLSGKCLDMFYKNQESYKDYD